MTSKKIFPKTKCLELISCLRKCLFIAGTLRNLSKETGLSVSTLHRIAQGNYLGNYSTRARLETYVEYNAGRRPI